MEILVALVIFIGCLISLRRQRRREAEEYDLWIEGEGTFEIEDELPDK